jgi:hypothetical protein
MTRCATAALALLVACRAPDPGAASDGESAAAPAAAPAAARESADSAIALIESRVPRAAAGDSGWQYQQRASADFDGDGRAETAVLIADVMLDARGRPGWEDGHRWQVYVEEADGARTYAYARFLPMGKLTAELTRPDSGPPTILLLEQTPHALGVYEIRYAAPTRISVVRHVERAVHPGTFAGSPRP